MSRILKREIRSCEECPASVQLLQTVHDMPNTHRIFCKELGLTFKRPDILPDIFPKRTLPPDNCPLPLKKESVKFN